MDDKHLNRMSVADLRDLSKRVDATISRKQSEERDALKASLDAVGKEHGFSISDLFSKRGRKAAPKKRGDVAYRNPANPAETWTGRGRRPKWMAGLTDLDRLRV